MRGAVDGQSTQPFDFTGELRDAESGFIYLRSRMYDPATGRFTSRDPLAGLAGRSQTQNRFSYAGNNPVSRTDPSGRAFTTGDPAGGCVDPDCATPVPFNQTTTAASTGALPQTPAAVANSAVPSTQSAPVISGLVNEFNAVQAAKASENVAIRLTGFVEEGAAVVAGTSLLIGGGAAIIELAPGIVAPLVTVASPTGPLFARFGGSLNTNPFFRIGVGWNDEIKSEVFRIAIGSRGLPIWRHIGGCPAVRGI